MNSFLRLKTLPPRMSTTHFPSLSLCNLSKAVPPSASGTTIHAYIHVCICFCIHVFNWIFLAVSFMLVFIYMIVFICLIEFTSWLLRIEQFDWYLHYYLNVFILFRMLQLYIWLIIYLIWWFILAIMESESKCILVLAGKSTTEKELANSMKASNILKLPDIEDVSVLLHSESRNEESFRVNSYMNSLSTKCFGRFFIWSPRLPSTHDVVSKWVMILFYDFKFDFC